MNPRPDGPPTAAGTAGSTGREVSPTPGDPRPRGRQEGGGCDERAGSHRWEELGERRVCRDCRLIDLTWSLWRRRMVDALRAAGSGPREQD